MNSIRTLWRLLRLAEHLLGGILLTLLIGRSARLRKRQTAIVSWWHRRLCRVLGIRIVLRGEPPVRGELLVANHVSWLDIPVLGALCPTAFVAKAEVRRWPLVGWLAERAGTCFIARGAGRTARVCQAMAGQLRKEHLLAVFPEGTTTDGRRLLRFHPRLMAPAIAVGRPLRPAAIRYRDEQGLDPVAPFIGEETFIHHLWRVLRHPGIRVDVTFCAPLAPPHPARRELADQARAAILAALGPLPERAPAAQPPEQIPSFGPAHG